MRRLIYISQTSIDLTKMRKIGWKLVFFIQIMHARYMKGNFKWIKHKILFRSILIVNLITTFCSEMFILANVLYRTPQGSAFQPARRIGIRTVTQFYLTDYRYYFFQTQILRQIWKKWKNVLVHDERIR